MDVLYLCDRRSCSGRTRLGEDCNPECKHTFDIRHAKNFELGMNGESMWEIEKSQKGENEMKLPDSGVRREFETGAVRDIADGKGRCDLLPLDTIKQLLDHWDSPYEISPPVFEWVDLYLTRVETEYLFYAICQFVDDAFEGDIYRALIELSIHYEDGAKKYSPNNWKLGIPVHCFIDSAIRHYLKYLRGDTDEPHDRAVLWNLVGAIWTHDNKPEMRDIHGVETADVDFKVALDEVSWISNKFKKEIETNEYTR